MNRVILQVAVSIDGYIAREDGSVDFLGNMDPSVTDFFNQFVSSIDTIIMGRNTYDMMLGFGEFPFKNKKVYVLTAKAGLSSDVKIIFTNENIKSILEEEIGNVWLFGGAKVIQSFMNLDLVDEFQLFVVPQILGSGIPLFLNNIGLKDLVLDSHQSFGNNLLLTYIRKAQ